MSTRRHLGLAIAILLLASPTLAQDDIEALVRQKGVVQKVPAQPEAERRR